MAKDRLTFPQSPLHIPCKFPIIADMLPSEITEDFLAKDYPVLRIRTRLCEADIALHGAHLIHWKPATADHALIYTSPSAIYREGKAIRGGIPLCWPWFNAHPSDPGQHPSHGVARDRFWTLESAEIRNGEARLTLTLAPTEATRSHVPYEFELRAIFTLGRRCHVALETTNLSDDEVTIGGALHSYLAVSGITGITIEGLQKTPYLDTTTSPEEFHTETSTHFSIDGEVDRIYYDTSSAVIIDDPAWHRKVLIEKENSETTIVWNPGAQKGAALSDLPDDGYEGFVCIEAGNARHDARRLAPGATHRLATRISEVS